MMSREFPGFHSESENRLLFELLNKGIGIWANLVVYHLM